jgi:hypothetical protein
MKVFLQHKVTHLYLSNEDNWIRKSEEARDFGSSLKAMDFLQDFKLDQANIVLKFDDPKYDIILRIKPRADAPSGDRPRL